MNERLARLARLFYTLQQCTERILNSKLEVDDDAYRLAVTRIGQMLIAIGAEKLFSERSVTQHWINSASDNVDEFVRNLPLQGRYTITAADVARLIESAPGPDDPSMRRRS